MKRRYVPIFVLALASLLHCAQPAQIAQTTTCSAAASTAALSGVASAYGLTNGINSTRSTTATAAVTFYGDLEPILNSSVPGAAYKCTTCHAAYAQAEGMNNVTELNRVVAAMTEGSMPRGGDRVPADKIQLFRNWQIQGFQAGSPSLVQQQVIAATTPVTPTTTKPSTTGAAAVNAGAANARSATGCP